MVKLIRLATNNDGIFENTFANNIILETNAKIALLNLTFQVQPGKVLIDDINSSLIFSSQGGVDPTLSFITQGEVEVDKTFFDGLNEQLNRLLTDVTDLGDFPQNEPNAMTRASTYSEWELLRNQVENFNSLTYRYATLTTPFGPTYNPATPSLATENQVLFEYDPNDLIPNAVYPPSLELPPGLQASPEPRYYATPENPDGCMSSGTGLYMARIADFVDQASGLGDNGFGIGLSIGERVPPPDGGRQVIPDIFRDFEIEFVGEGLAYNTIEDGTPKPTLIVAERGSLTNYPDVDEHDIIWFRIAAPTGEQFNPTAERGYLIAGVWQLDSITGEAKERIFFEKYLDDSFYKPDGRLFPYIYVNGAQGTVKVDSVAFTPSPFTMEDPQTGSPWAEFGQRDYSLFFQMSDPPNGDPPKEMAKVTPFIDLDRFEVDRPLDFKIHSDVLRAMGFIALAQRTSTTGYVFIDENVGLSEFYGVNGQWRALSSREATSALSDNFMVISDTLNLESFDASDVLYGSAVGGPGAGAAVGSKAFRSQEKQGRRQNILMTIPVNDNNDGVVEFQTNTPIFIDIQNKDKLNLRNMNFRILRKDFTPIVTQGREAIMTLLIDDLIK